MEVVLTDGAGVFLVVLVKEMWLVMGGRKKGRKAAASMARVGEGVVVAAVTGVLDAVVF